MADTLQTRPAQRQVLSSLLTGGISLRGVARAHAMRRLHTALTGRTVLISGASSGIGHATARQVAAAGASVVLIARSDEKLRELAAEIEAGGGSARVYTCDLSRSDSTDALLAALAADQVEVDVLINNAGRSIRRRVVDSCDRLHDFERTMALNYFGSLRLILGLLPRMRARRTGHVINVSSAGVQLSTPLFSAYIASKAALDAFTRVAAAELRDSGVRFSTIHMPLVRTPMIAPTAAYRGVEALTPEAAAEIVVRAIVTRERQLATGLARLVGLAHLVLPDMVEQLLNLAQRQEG